MSNKRRWVPLAASAVAVGVIALTTAAVYPAVTQAADSASAPSSSVRWNRGSDWDDRAALAEVLGISEEELDAAVAEAQQAAIDQAVAEGRLTEEQAAALAEGDFGRMGRRGLSSSDGLLAEALGITGDELAAARNQVVADRLAQAVADGDMTQAQVDRLLAQQAFQEYQRDRAQAETEAAVQAAVEAGAITQAQADLLLEDSQKGVWGRGLFGRGTWERGLDGMRGHGGRGDGPMLDHRGFPGGERGGRGFPGQMPGGTDDSGNGEQEDAEEATPETESGFSRPSVLPDVIF